MMLALRSAPKSSNSNETLTGHCTPNILPCRIHYDGPIDATKRHWHIVKDEKEDKQTSYFRGRKLQGRLVQLPEGYEGVVASPTDRLVPGNGNRNIENELLEEPVKILESQATFDNFVVWGHEIPPAADDTVMKEPPLILSPSSVNDFTGLADLHGIWVKNPSTLEAATLQVNEPTTGTTTRYAIPPGSSFIIGNLTASKSYSESNVSPISGLPSTEKFNIILFDPPWPNRSVRRSSQYLTHGYLEMDSLVATMQQTILSHLRFGDESAIVGIWTTNNAKSRQAAYDAFSSTGLGVSEIWVWIKTTENGELVSPLGGLWRKPYEVLFLGRPKKNPEKAHKGEPLKRVIAAVPDEHSRKPNLKEMLEILFFRVEEKEVRDTPRNNKQYTALEVFARNLTAGWCACGNDVLKFNADQWWYQP
ncbi:uncharacterized protein BHQ10_007079 [Talaromyces amestolkiae]|uniref:MT-A70-domain-containing protein n=1 Tax=Talaromyces amestolkiae TaxID=1196081 RepID=A0A364L5H6_TALAM|nr:uncharacterized protein BHQ10_007079 [Talaromyces amestolkiae]RAO71067.1 hypothetical protein BHQ10_007079 [Talaromyces amestolkiae]